MAKRTHERGCVAGEPVEKLRAGRHVAACDEVDVATLLERHDVLLRARRRPLHEPHPVRRLLVRRM